MIGYIQGQIKVIRSDHIVVVTGGLGYVVFCPASYIEEYSLGHTVELIIETKVSESDIVLFGLNTEEEISLFRKLCTVQGLGGKTALSLISQLGYDEICQAVLSSDDKSVASAKGIGAKTALKVIVDLKKYVEETYNGATALALDEGSASAARHTLKAMGVDGREAADLIKRTAELHGSDLKAGEIVREALKLRGAA